MANIIRKQLEVFEKAAKEGSLDNMSCFLSYLRLKGKPMTLKKHFMLTPLYATRFPMRILWKCGRQVGKSAGLASQGTLQSNFIPRFNTLFIQPRFDQIKYFSNIVMRPFIRESFLADSFVGSDCEDSVLMRTFRNKSRVHYSYCLTGADRIRGIAGIDKLAIDECQDIDADFIPVMAETMSASEDFGIYQFTGTPKTTDNVLNVYWEDTSMAEWVIPCSACNKLNIPSIDQDLEKMIGAKTLICAKCGRPADARKGWFEHAVPSRRNTFAGYHISQPIHPMHYTNARKWNELLIKIGGYRKALLYNEVFGEACDDASKLVSIQDIKQASDPGRRNTIEDAMAIRNWYETVVLGVDWTGGGQLEDSTTALCFSGIRSGTDNVDVLYMERLPGSMEVPQEIARIVELSNMFKVSYLAHDYTGAGNLRQILLEQAGFPRDQIVGYSMTYSPSKEVITYTKPTGGHREAWTIDKSRSLLITCNMIIARKIIFPEFESSLHLTTDFTALQEDVRDMPRGGTMYVITKAPKKPDDMAIAVNLACATIWHARDAYPTVTGSERFMAKPELMELSNPVDVDWDS